jgi:aminoglycoside phosphotransferase (APT) family kinase protein
MGARKMHADEVETDVALVRRLLAAQFPHWAHLPLRPVVSAGTDNALFRLGDDFAVRLPRRAATAGQPEKEYRWLPRMASSLPLAIPVPLALGAPGEGYPFAWSVCRWLQGEQVAPERVADPRQCATALAHFLAAIQRLDPTGGPPPGPHNFGRGAPLSARDAAVRTAIAALRPVDLVDCDAATAAWETSLRASAWHAAPVWLHGDVAPGNLLTVRSVLSGVIDFGCLGVGDPACDLMIAWTLFTGASREAFRAALAVDDATWARGRGWALSWALIFIPYYLHTNPAGVHGARRTIAEVLADPERGTAHTGGSCDSSDIP